MAKTRLSGLHVDGGGVGATPAPETNDVVIDTSVTVGVGGATIKAIKTGTVAIDPPPIAATTRGAATVTLAGVAVGDIVVMQPPAALNDDLLFVGAAVTAADTVTVYLYNPTAAAIDDVLQTWRYLWFDLT